MHGGATVPTGALGSCGGTTDPVLPVGLVATTIRSGEEEHHYGKEGLLYSTP